MSQEIRALLKNLEYRKTENGPEYIDGYAAVFNEPTVIWDFEEVIAPGAFARALKEGQDVVALFNHDSNFPLARTGNDSLILREDSKGLWTEARVSKNPTSESIIDYVRSGIVSGMSFAFTVRKNEWEFQEPGSAQMDRRVITEIGTLFDVSVVTSPAYKKTSVKVRADAKKLHDEARSRWEERKKVFQVPAEYGVSYAEFRSVDAGLESESWQAEVVKVEAKNDVISADPPPPSEDGEKAPVAPTPSEESPQAEIAEPKPASSEEGAVNFASADAARRRDLAIRKAKFKF